MESDFVEEEEEFSDSEGEVRARKDSVRGEENTNSDAAMNRLEKLYQEVPDKEALKQLSHLVFSFSSEQSRCSYCSFNSQNVLELKLHLASAHDGVIVHCIQCDFTSKRRDTLLAHVKIAHTGGLDKMRGVKNSDPSNVDDNKQNLHSDNSTAKEIEDCSSMSSTNDEGEKGNEDHVSDQLGIYTCEECGVLCSSKRELNEHCKDVHGGRKFKCNLCDFVCLTHGGLYLHNSSVHLGIRFKCDKCDYEGTQEVNLKRHMESKHGKVVYCCKLCSVQTKVSWYFENHLKRKHGILDKNEYYKFTDMKECKQNSVSTGSNDEYAEVEDEMEVSDEENLSTNFNGNNEEDYFDEDEERIEPIVEINMNEDSDIESVHDIELFEPRVEINTEDDIAEEGNTTGEVFNGYSMSPRVEITTEDDIAEEGNPPGEVFNGYSMSHFSFQDDDDLSHKSPKFGCKQCGFIANSSGTLTRHVSVVHRGVRWSCRLCGYVTTVKCSMVRHVQSIHQGWRYRCMFCNHESTQKGGLKYHVEKKHPGHKLNLKWSDLAPVKSRENAQISGIEDLDVTDMFDEITDAASMEHIIGMRGRQSEKVPSESMIIEPSVEISEGSGEDITVPDEQMARYPVEEAHYVGEDHDFSELFGKFSQNGEETLVPVSCDLCTYSTARIGNMRRHVLAVHQGVRFPCNLCSYRAPDKGSLLRHTRGVHQGLRFYCDFCQYSATQKGNLKNHQEKRHQDQKYSCMFCDFSVNWKGSFIKHLQSLHGDLLHLQGITSENSPLLSFHMSTYEQRTQNGLGGDAMDPSEGTSNKFYKTDEKLDDNIVQETLSLTHENGNQEKFEEHDATDTYGENDSQEVYDENYALVSFDESRAEDTFEEGDTQGTSSETIPKPADQNFDISGQPVFMNFPIKTQNMTAVDKELESSRVVLETETDPPNDISNRSEIAIIPEEEFTDGNTYACSVCDYKANSSASLARHNGAVHKGIRWQCKDCDFITRDKSSLKRHRRNRHEGIRFQCNYCDYDAGQKGNIKSHMDRRHPEIPYDHTEFKETKVEGKAKKTIDFKPDKVDPNQVALNNQLAGMMNGLGNFNAFNAHILSTFLQAKMMQNDDTSFLSTDDESSSGLNNHHHPTDPEDFIRPEVNFSVDDDSNDSIAEVDTTPTFVKSEPTVEEDPVCYLDMQVTSEDPSSPSDSSPAPSSSEPNSILLNALRSMPCSSSSPTLTPRKSLLDTLKFNEELLKAPPEDEKKSVLAAVNSMISSTHKPKNEFRGHWRGRRRNHGAPVLPLEGDPDGTLACLECNFMAKSQGTLFRHVQSVHRGIKFSCPHCEFVTIDKGSLKRHVNGQHDGVRHKCDLCDYENAQIGNVKKHFQTKHQNIVYHCPYCILEAKHRWYLEQHVRRLHPEKLREFDIQNVVPRIGDIKHPIHLSEEGENNYEGFLDQASNFTPPDPRLLMMAQLMAAEQEDTSPTPPSSP